MRPMYPPPAVPPRPHDSLWYIGIATFYYVHSWYLPKTPKWSIMAPRSRDIPNQRISTKFSAWTKCETFDFYAKISMDVIEHWHV